MIPPTHLEALIAMGLRLVPAGGRPPKTARDVAVFLAMNWFAAPNIGGRPKLREAVCDLWQSKGYRGITDPAHVTARQSKGKAVCEPDGADVILMKFKGRGTTARYVGPGAGVLLIPQGSATPVEGGHDFHGLVWSWTFGDELAQHFEATGRVLFTRRASEN